MFNWFRKWLRKWFVKPPRCKYCKYKQDAGSTWYCKKQIKGQRYNYKSICSRPKVRTAPSWCPLKQ